MSRLRSSWLMWCAGAVGLSSSPALAQTQPNILVFVLDDFGNSKVSSYAADYAGYAAAASYLPETRTIDELAAAGLRFSRAWASPNCSPTRASLQTGRQPYVHGIGSPLPAGGPSDQNPELDTNAHQMLADSFVLEGYATGYFGKWHLGVTDAAGSTTAPSNTITASPHPALAGWDRFFGTIDGDVDSYKSWDRVRWDENNEKGDVAIETTHATTKTAQAARNWINQQSGPFLAVVSFHAPHKPTDYDWEYTEVDPTMIRSTAIQDCVDGTTVCNEALATYAALVEHADIQIERTLDAMDPEVLENTLIIVMGDNGTPDDVQEGAFDVAGRSKGTAYETGIRIPLIVAHGNTFLNGGAGAITYPGTVIRAGVHVVDVYQTLHQYALGYNVAPSEGSDFTDCFTSNDLYCNRATQYGYAETFKRDTSGAFTEGEAGVRYGHDKMVVFARPGDTCWTASFYDTFTDQFEVNDLALPVGDPDGDRLRDYFAAIHTSSTATWGRNLGFCN